LASVKIGKKGRPRWKTARALPFNGKRSLRGVLKRDKQLAPFLKIPTKENGLDVEGIVATKKSLFLGLRGPVIATKAVLLEFPLKTALRKPGKRMRKHLLDLGGLGVRDLGRRGEEVLILAGPVTSTGGPFRLFRWQPNGSPRSRNSCMNGSSRTRTRRASASWSATAAPGSSCSTTIPRNG
jgi:hypothetical protein